jgi:hypothetical protein
MNFYREICANWAVDNAVNRRLGGPGAIVEIDESKLWKAKHHRGRALLIDPDRTWVFGMLGTNYSSYRDIIIIIRFSTSERGTRNVVLVAVQRRDAATLLPIIQEWILPGTRIVSDMWAAYGGINNLQQQYNHRWVNHRLNFVDPGDRTVHTNGIEGQWAILKNELRHLRGLSADLFESYLFRYLPLPPTPLPQQLVDPIRRYMFRRAHSNQADGGTQIFNALLKEIRRQYPLQQ